MKLRHFSLLFLALPALLQLVAQTPDKYVRGLTAVPDKSIMNEDGTTFIEVLANDMGLGKGKIGVTIKGSPAHGTAVVNEDNTITYSPFADYNGMDVFTYQICNEKNERSVSAVTIIINPVNDLPFADSMVITQSLYADDHFVTLTIPGITGVFDTNVRTFAIVKNPAHGTVSTDNTGKYVYFPETTFNGSDTIVYQVCDTGIPCFCSKGMIILNVKVSNISAVEVYNFQSYDINTFPRVRSLKRLL
jgi:dTDP-4-dehydrorhamnose 3,5-epimerase-like enzyme